jgi:hypothetical protein
MKCTVTMGYFGRVLIEAKDERGKWSGLFEPGRRTLTAARNRNGELRMLTAVGVLDYLGVPRDQLCAPYDSMELDDRGIFGELTPVDLSQQARFVFNIISQPVHVLMGACALETRKADR